MNSSTTITNNNRNENLNRCDCSKCKSSAGTARVCFNARKLAARTALVSTAGLLRLLLVCLFLQGTARAGATLPAVGPSDAEQREKISVGYLTVFSSTEEPQWGEGPYYYVHTGYRIYDSAGKTVKWVANHDNSTDETPAKVELAPGRYTVWAQSDKDGFVKVPVVIKLARTTFVRLENV